MEVFDDACPKMIRLIRPVATELTLLAVLAPLCVSDIAVGFCATLNKGAIISSQQEPKVMQALWRGCGPKGGYSKLLTPSQSVLSRTLEFEEEEEPKQEPIRRPLAYRFDFIEVFAGSAKVTAKVAAGGFSVGCPIDLSYDSELDM